MWPLDEAIPGEYFKETQQQNQVLVPQEDG
jgi:hypothetical protein